MDEIDADDSTAEKWEPNKAENRGATKYEPLMNGMVQYLNGSTKEFLVFRIALMGEYPAM